jgi:hypothetical protein
MNISKDRETAHSWRALNRVLGPYGLIQHRESRQYRSLSPLRYHIVTPSTTCDVALFGRISVLGAYRATCDGVLLGVV